jgi:MFS family permease
MRLRRGGSVSTTRIALPRALSALRHRNFRLFFFGQLISLIGTWMQTTAQGWLIVMLVPARESNLYLGIVTMSASLPMMFATFFGGVLADRHDKRKILIITQTSALIQAFILAAVVYAGSVQVWHVVVLSFFLGLTNAIDMPTRQAFITEMVGNEDLGNAIALNSSIFNNARAFGPAITGLLLAAHVRIGDCFTLNALSFVAVIVGLLMMRPRELKRSAPQKMRVREGLREALTYLKQHRGMKLLIMLVSVMSVFGMAYVVLLPSFAKYILHTDARGYGLLQTGIGLGALAGGITLASLSMMSRRVKFPLMAGAAYTALIVAFAFDRSLTLAFINAMLIGASFAFMFPICNTLIQLNTPDYLRGRIMAIYSLMFIGMTPITGLLAGAIGRFLGSPVAIGFGGGVSLLVLGVTFFTMYPALKTLNRMKPLDGWETPRNGRS